MRRISLLLIIAIMCSCFGSFTPVFAVETVGMVASEEIGLLSELGIIYAPEDEMEYLDVVTRADFAVYVASMLNLNEYDLRDTRYYTDVPMDHWGLSAINGLTEMGVINGYMGEFNPDEPVTVDQAVKILAKVLGYDTGEEFPIIDNSQLKTLRRNLLEGVENTSGNILLGDAVNMIYNALEECVLQPYLIGEDYSLTHTDETLLEFIYDISAVEGIVKEVYGISAVAEPGGDINTIRIGDERFENKLDENLNKYLGREVLGFYYDNEEMGTKELRLIFTKQKAAKEVKFDIADLISFDTVSRQLRYYDEKSEQVKTVSYSAKTVAVKNGKDVTANLAENVKDLKKGTIELVWNDGCSVLIIREYYNIATGFINTSTMHLYDEYNSGNYIDFTPQDNVYKRIWSADGESLELSDIAVSDVISVYKSENYIDAYVSKKTLSGKINKIKTENDKTFLEIDSVYYEVDSDFSASERGKSVQLGQDVILYFDVYNKIANTGNISVDNLSFGYVVEAALVDKVFSDELKLKILTINGELAEFVCEKKMRVDGEEKEGGTKQKTAVMNYNGKEDNLLIRYKLSDEGKITEIDTPYVSAEEEKERCLSVTGQKGDYYYTTYSMNLGKLILLDSATVFFAVPSAEKIATADEDDYQIITKNNLVSSTTYPMEIYQVDKEDDTGDVVLLFDTFIGATGETELTSLFLVDEKIQKYDEEQGIYEAVKGMSEGLSAEHLACEGYDFNDFDSGDLVVLKRNVKGEITGIDTKLYDFSDGTKKGAGSNWNSWGVTYGYPIKFRNNVLTLSNSVGGNAAELIDTTGVPITVYDARGRSPICRAGSNVDLIDAKNSGGLVYVCRRYTKPRSIVVYLGL